MVNKVKEKIGDDSLLQHGTWAYLKRPGTQDGEGAGYAGGITSAAMDGIKVAETVCRKYAAIKNN